MFSLVLQLLTAAHPAALFDRPQAASSHVESRLVIRAPRLLDPGSDTDQRNVVVVVEGRRIAGIVPAARYRPRPGDSVLALGPGTTLLPGLIDAHVHLVIGGAPNANASLILRAGFTTAADLGARTRQLLPLRDSIAMSAIEGPRVLTAGQWIGVKDGVCEFRGIGVAGGVDAFRTRVRENLSAGADLIKACVSGWPAVAWAFPDSAELPLEILTAMVAEGRGAGRPVVAHALSAESVRRSLMAGVAGLVHAAYLNDSLARQMRQRGIWLVPTLASLTAGDTSQAGRDLVAAVGRAQRAGVTLVYGTDGGVLPHGRNAEEAVALLAAGVPAAEILRAATTNAAAALGLSDSVGSVRRGMIADLIAVPGDPLTDITVLQHPTFVMARGRVVVP